MVDMLKAPKPDLKKLSPTAGALTSLALVCGFFAVAWLSVAGHSTRGTMLWVAPTAFAFLAFMFMLMAGITSLKKNAAAVTQSAAAVTQSAAAVTESAAAVTESASAIKENAAVITENASLLRERIQPVDPGFHIGCRIGRRHLECGILKVTPQNTRLTSEGLPLSQAEVSYWTDGEITGRLSEGALYSGASLGRLQQSNLYGEVIAHMGKLFKSAYQKKVQINSIGIAVPGGVHPHLGHFDGLVEGGPFVADEDITGKVATRLVQEIGVTILDDVLGTSNPEAMRARIHLDNDARCATRWLLVENPTWQNMACVFAGSGVGSGLVFGREVFYGNRFRAGEIGHVNLNPGTLFLLDEMSGMALQPRYCSCGKEGYHFESLASIGGLGHLAQVINESNLRQICEMYMADPEQRRQIEAEAIDDEDANGRVILRALAHVGEQNPLFDPYIEPSKAFVKCIHTRPISDYLAHVVTTYARLFGTGIAALLAALDVEHIALCGTIPEYLRNNLRFTREVQKSLDDNIPWTPTGSADVHYGNMRPWSWRGAALLSSDPGYRRRRFPQSLSRGEPETTSDIQNNQAR